MNKALENVAGDKTLMPLKADIDKIYKAYLIMEDNMNDENFKEFCLLIRQVRNNYVV